MNMNPAQVNTGQRSKIRRGPTGCDAENKLGGRRLVFERHDEHDDRGEQRDALEEERGGVGRVE